MGPRGLECIQYCMEAAWFRVPRAEVPENVTYLVGTRMTTEEIAAKCKQQKSMQPEIEYRSIPDVLAVTFHYINYLFTVRIIRSFSKFNLC